VSTDSDGLVLLDVVEPPKMSIWKSLRPASKDEMTMRVATPVGEFRVTNLGHTTTVTGAASVKLPVVGLAGMKKGVTASVNGASVAVFRPHFGFRRSARSVHAEGDGVALVSHYHRDRRYDISRRDGFVVFRRDRRSVFAHRAASAPEVGVALALDLSGSVAGSSLLHWLTTP
jgi:hypothetical protein